MAENLLSSAASAVTGELPRALFSGLMGKLGRKDASAAAADKKLRRLDMLLIKINSAVEASEKHAIENNASLVTWRDRLKEAAAEAGEVLASFRQRETEAEAAAAAQAQATGDGDGGDAQAQQHQHQHQHQEDPSSSSSSSTASATATAGDNNNSNAPSGSGMPQQAQGILSATKTTTLLFSSEEDMERLNSAVERLEDLSNDISIFIKLFKLEILAPAHAPALAPALMWTETTGRILKKSRPAGPPGACSSTGEERRPFDSRICAMTEEIAEAQASWAAGEETTLLGRLEEALATVCRIVELADGRDLSGYEWLAYWASVLREAKSQGRAVVLGAMDGRAGDEAARWDDQEDSELGRFVRTMETLARDADSFSDLAGLCARRLPVVLVAS